MRLERRAKEQMNTSASIDREQNKRTQSENICMCIYMFRSVKKENENIDNENIDNENIDNENIDNEHEENNTKKERKRDQEREGERRRNTKLVRVYIVDSSSPSKLHKCKF